MSENDVRAILKAVASNGLSVDEAEKRIASSNFHKLGEFAKLDMAREKRTGFPEVVFGASKTADEITAITEALIKKTGRAFVTKISEKKARAVMEATPGVDFTYNVRAQTLRSLPKPEKCSPSLKAAVVSGGTSDLAVVLESKETLEFCGWKVLEFNDVGVAGLERLLKVCPKLNEVDVIIAVAGMEGALPTVLAGLTATPIIAVPTSVGYGVSNEGLAALHGMLASCAPGLSVVNIDNGFGAAVAAHRILLGKLNMSILETHGR